MNDDVRVFSPATVSNVACGFDILGFPLESVGDEMTVRKTQERGLKINNFSNFDLPVDINQNVASVSALALIDVLKPDCGFEIDIIKKIKPGSGIGSSAASSAGAVVAVNELLGRPFSEQELTKFAMEGEKLASGTAHADNVAPVIFGGCTMVSSYNPLNIIKIEAPEDLYATVIHPQIEVKTADSRSVLKQNVSLKTVVKQMGNFGGLISGLYTKDYELIGKSLNDDIIEPNRSILIPAFDNVKEISKNKGALGSGISGSGPSIFALSKGKSIAENVAEGMAEVYNKIGVDFDIYVSKINPNGVKII